MSPVEGGGTPKRWASGSKVNDEDRPEIFNCLGFVEADLDILKQMVRELQDLTQAPWFPEQREEYQQSAMKIFRKDHLGGYEGLSGAIKDEGEVDASGEEMETKYADETLGRDNNVVREKEMVQDVKPNKESEMGSRASSKESEMASEKLTPKAKVSVPNIVESEESEESAKSSDMMSGDGEELEDESDDARVYLPTKGKKSGKQVVKK
ncbi:hypothetical protein M422DRAFT_273833 [Sphaerobolus stellatus SS14]|uniref:Uncharacterized protein n=1 Tax=Sphaerobolus stellatus (strain SS14) TaxID=990650 RepID=A0A0C9UIZ7_SPHS4|nr:hypothetical protein M422DRAFT_273833 [Sphaerobolus stellatus SS14]